MKKLILLSLLTVSLVGCNSDHQKVNANDTSVAYHDAVWFGKISQVTTPDGVDCVVFFGEKKGGISCNWEKYNKENP